MRTKWVGILLAFGLMAACDHAGGFRPSKDSPFAPTGVKRSEDFVDGLLVGHRLMQAGQFELALKAYLRAAGEQGMNTDVLSALGSVNLRLGRLGQAEKLLRQAVASDETFAPAWNNLGVVLMEQGNIGEAQRVFRTAFALDSGESAEIRENLRLAIEKLEKPAYLEDDNNTFALVRRGRGKYLLLSKP
ncbi:MAG: tetratricopeptide repeat protein [Marinosulfonomonas sp.]|nr:tetratricopeptide repeat protein [Marinosulfonomonas sp.]